MDINVINRNTNNFNFVETLGSFINNYKFKKGFDDFKGNQNNKGTYIWQALSAIGNDYAEVIYENVLNYIDNVSNVDMCNVKALQSMIKIAGIQYNVIDSFSNIPVELARLIDVLSINPKYLLDNKTFKADFIELLKSSGVIKTAEQDGTKLSSEFKDETLKTISDSSTYIDESKYSAFLYDLYYSILSSFVYMKYADGENGISATTENDGYIYEYLQDDILAGQMQADVSIQTAYESKMAQLKIKYGIDKNFDQQQIVDNIEDGYDSFDKYNIFEQEILQQEIDRRQATYSFDKSYRNSTTLAYGMNLTRYSYYREKKVKEYFKFIENTYNNLIVESNIKELVEDDSSKPIIDQYSRDVNYFDVNQQAMKTLLVFNDATNKVEIETAFIDAITRLLVQQTFEIAQLRDQVKIQIRKSYMRGTFLLVSYIINEFLKYNISQKYGLAFQTEDGQYLKDILDKSIADGGNVELIEYYDDTEYYNITRGVDSKAKNSDTVNNKFWDEPYSKIGQTTRDIPLNEIEDFYKNQMKLNRYQADDIVNFLSIIYEYGANPSYIDKDTEEFKTPIFDKKIGGVEKFIGEPAIEAPNIQDTILSVQTMKEKLDFYSGEGFQQLPGTLQHQLNDLTTFISGYYIDQISNTNSEAAQSASDQIADGLEQLQSISQSLDEISSSYYSLLNNDRYKSYFSSYVDLIGSNNYFYDQIVSAYNYAVDNSKWKTEELSTKLIAIKDSYASLFGNMKSKLFELSVQATSYWPYYLPQYDDEITAITRDLKNFLITEIQTGSPTDAQKTQINKINSKTSTEWNILYIDTKFNACKLSIDEVLNGNQAYFGEYVNSYGKLDAQIDAMINYSNNRNAACQTEASIAINAISTDYQKALTDFKVFSYSLNRSGIQSIDDNLEYVVEQIPYTTEVYSKVSSTYGNKLDYLLSGNYRDETWAQKLSGAIYWLSNSINTFNNQAIEKTLAKVSHITDYVESIDYINFTKYDCSALISDDTTALLDDKLDNMVSALEDKSDYIESKSSHYDTSHDIYLRYNGTDIGYDPFYNHKNQAYSSYQIHPYLYNFIEKTNLVYPLANSFFQVFSPDYEHEIYTKGLDNLFGQNGNIKDLWKNGMLDWTGYQSSYERQSSLKNFSSTNANPMVGFKGLFYPPALNALFNDHDNFMQSLQDNREDSYYYHLNYSDAQRQKIYDQILAYENVIRHVATAQYTSSLTGQFDIYKYAEDCMGNSIFLLKSYKHLYEAHADEPNYSPSYHEKRNTLGEIWMRPKDCPLAFPAFDLRNGYEDVAQYSIKKQTNSYAQNINEYVLSLDWLFKQHENSSNPDISAMASLTRDSIGECQLCATNIPIDARNVQHLRCFYDFETDVLNQSLLLAIPYKTGRNNQSIYFNSDMTLKTPINASKLRYADSSIMIGYLGDHQLINIMSDQTYVYNFTADIYPSTNTNVNDIENPQMLINGKLAESTKNTNCFYEFIGFTKYKTNVYVMFVKKLFDYTENSQFGSINLTGNKIQSPIHKFTLIKGSTGQVKKNKPQLELRYVSYKCHLEPEVHTVTSDELLYDCYDWHKDRDQIYGCDYTNASNVAIGGGNGLVTIGYVTERFNPKQGNDYANNSQIVNFAEYSSQIENYSTLSSYGTNNDYPRSTALIQTTDSQHINIYNSFDSFAQYLVNVNFKFVGGLLKHNSTEYFNLNSDLGFLPQYVDHDGLTRYYNNTALSNADSFNIQLLGPEKSDVPFTPVIKVTTDEKYGRIVEDYKNFTSMSSTLSTELSINASASSVTHVFQLSSIYVDSIMSPTMPRERAIEEWKQLVETSELLRYKYILYNTDYLSQPILKGNLSDLHENGYYYQSSEKYDLLSGEEIVGPNSTTYQSNVKSNHIDGISSIGMTITYDADTKIPQTLKMKVNARDVASSVRTIDPNTFYLLLYAKNTLQSYQYYHLFENANANLTSDLDKILSGEEEYALDLSKTTDDLSSVQTYTGKYLFRNQSESSNYHNMKAMSEFKYSEEDPVDREFPFIDTIDVEDEITIVENDSQSIYYFAIDSHSIVDLGTITLKSFQPDWTASNATGQIVYKKINTILPKYSDFFDRALTIEATYNLEQKPDLPTTSPIEYENVLYFNYMNYTNPQYVHIEWPEDDRQAPTSYVHNSTDDEIKHTYLALRPGQSGRLDIRIDFLDYQRLTQASIGQSIVGAASYIIATYYIMNTSDDKPKFIVSRAPFSTSAQTIEEENYELES